MLCTTYSRSRFFRFWMNQGSQQWYDLDPRPRGITMSQVEWCTAPITMAVSHSDPPASRAGCNHDTISAAGHQRVMGCDRQTRGTGITKEAQSDQLQGLALLKHKVQSYETQYVAHKLRDNVFYSKIVSVRIFFLNPTPVHIGPLIKY